MNHRSNNVPHAEARTTTDDTSNTCAHPHIPLFLALPTTEFDDDGSNNARARVVQIVRNGRDLTADNFRCDVLSIHRPVLVTDSPESIGMKVPPPTFTIRDVAEMVGGAYPVHVLDVQLQMEMEGWTINDLVEYFEDPRRKYRNQQPKQERECNNNNMTETSSSAPSSYSSSTSRRPRRAAAIQSQVSTSMLRSPVVLNQLSLEISQTAMGPPFIQSPKFVRDMDWISLTWPDHWYRRNKYPMVQYYCLTSAAGSWTDFHIDFGGTSVWYHVLSGAKEFCLIPPTSANLQAYQAWLCSKHQDADFLPDTLPEHCRNGVYRIRLEPHQTFVIPSGWIHAVYTPEDSLVLGGNFVHGLAIQSQLQAHAIETVSHVTKELLFPYYRQLHVCAVGYYYSELAKSASLVVPKEKEEFPSLLEQVEKWVYQDNGKPVQEEEPTIQTLAKEMARKYNFSSFGALLDDFRRLLRIPMVHADIATSTFTTTSTSHAATDTVDDDSNKMPHIRIRTKLDSSRYHFEEGDDVDEEKEKPRIRLSQPQRALPIPVDLVAPRKREDVSSFVASQSNDDDEEWTPSSSSPTRTSPKRATSHKKRMRSTTEGGGSNNEETTRRKKKVSASRLRLLKKLK